MVYRYNVVKYFAIATCFSSIKHCYIFGLAMKYFSTTNHGQNTILILYSRGVYLSKQKTLEEYNQCLFIMFVT